MKEAWKTEKDRETGEQTVRGNHPVLKVHMMGTFFLEYGNRPIAFRKSMAKKSMRLLQILLYYQKTGISRAKLLEETYAREKVADAANSLRVGMFRLKQSLLDAGLPEGEYIRLEKGVYRWVSPVEVSVDALEFQELMEQAGEEQQEEKRSEIYLQAEALYRGEFLADFAEEPWVMEVSVHLKQQYTQGMKELCQYLISCRKYEKGYEISRRAAERYPFEEWQMVEIKCLEHLGRFSEAAALYEDTSKRYLEELGVFPPMEPTDAFPVRKESGEESRVPLEQRRVFLESLREEKQETGGYFCALSGFRDCFRVALRQAEEEGNTPWLLLLFLTGQKEKHGQGSSDIGQGAQLLVKAVQKNLLPSEFFCFFGDGKIAAFLKNSSQEACRKKEKRIRSMLGQEKKNLENRLDFFTVSVREFFLEETLEKRSID